MTENLLKRKKSANGVMNATDTNWGISNTMSIAGWTDGNYVVDLNIFET